jgi:hypothetical protein
VAGDRSDPARLQALADYPFYRPSCDQTPLSWKIQERGSNSVVECQLPKLDVVGSSPISRSIFSNLESPTSSSFTSFTSKNGFC